MDTRTLRLAWLALLVGLGSAATLRHELPTSARAALRAATQRLDVGAAPHPAPAAVTSTIGTRG